MRQSDTFKVYHPVTLGADVFFVVFAVWIAIWFLIEPAPTLVGEVFLFTFFVGFPASFGIAVIRNQLRLRNKSKQL